LSQRDAEVAWPRARSRHDGALRRHGRVSSPPAASLAEMRRAPTPEERGEFVADLDRIETQRSALPLDRAIHDGERTTGAEMPNSSTLRHGKASLEVARLDDLLTYLLGQGIELQSLEKCKLEHGVRRSSTWHSR
jgi:hypothetical protein